MKDLTTMLPEVIALAKNAGSYLIAERQKFSENNVELKSLNNLVSYVDKKSEEMIVKGLHELLPEAGFIAEEGSAQHQGEAYKWIIDPLDGTTNFVHGIPCYCVSIALMHEEELVLGVIYDPERKESFTAIKGQGAHCNGAPIHVSNRDTIGGCLFGTGFPYDEFDRMDSYLQLFTHLMRNSRGLRRLGSAAIDLCYVACGRIDGFYEYGLCPWDVAAGILIVEEAGGKTSDFKGEKNHIFGEEIIATNEYIATDMLKLTKQFFY